MPTSNRLARKRLFTIPVSALLCCLLSACVESQNPVSDPAKAKPDPKLYGNWVWDKGQKALLGSVWPKFAVEKYKQPRKTKVPASPGLMMCHLWDSGGKKSSAPFFVTSFGRFGIATIVEKQGHTFLKYKLTGNQLQIWGGSAKSVIKQGLLKGTGKRLTDTTENTARFIRNGGDTKLFTERVVYNRVVPK